MSMFKIKTVTSSDLPAPKCMIGPLEERYTAMPDGTEEGWPVYRIKPSASHNLKEGDVITVLEPIPDVLREMLDKACEKGAAAEVPPDR